MTAASGVGRYINESLRSLIMNGKAH